MLVAVGLALLLPASAAGILAHRLNDRYQGALSRAILLDPSARRGEANGSAQEIAGPLNYLIIGSDRRPDGRHPDERADTVLIAHLPVGLRQAYLVSVPRDLMTTIAVDPATGYGGGPDKINAAFQYGGGGPGGARLLSATLTGLTGLRFDGAVIVDFAAFQTVIDLLGGIVLCVDTEVRSIHTNRLFPVGCQQLDGAGALDYARQRYGLPGGDHDRQRHQQQIIKAILEKAGTGRVLANPLRLDQLVRAAISAMTVDTNGMSAQELVRALWELRPDSLIGLRLPTYSQVIGEVSYELPGPGAEELFAALRGGEVAAWAATNPSWVNQL